jgi:signal transduction histidine kinase
MQQTEKTPAISSANQAANGAGRMRVERVMQTLATLRGDGESLSEVAHDARNMVTALGIYCDLLEEPGVLASPYVHYGHELRLVAAASRRLVERLVALDAHAGSSPAIEEFPRRNTGRWPLLTAAAKNPPQSAAPAASLHENDRNRRWDMLPAVPVANLAAELLANRNLLSALAGPSIALTVETEAGARPVRLTGEDLTRILVNLVKNASEAMPGGGRIAICLGERPSLAGTAEYLALTIEDNGPGIPESALEKIFTPGYTTRDAGKAEGGWALSHRGLGLAITRSIIEAAGGRIVATRRQEGGARFAIELPVREGGF